MALRLCLYMSTLYWKRPRSRNQYPTTQIVYASLMMYQSSVGTFNVVVKDISASVVANLTSADGSRIFSEQPFSDLLFTRLWTGHPGMTVCVIPFNNNNQRSGDVQRCATRSQLRRAGIISEMQQPRALPLPILAACRQSRKRNRDEVWRNHSSNNNSHSKHDRRDSSKWLT